MSLITRMRKQKVVYWGGPVKDGRGGYKSFDAPVELSARWERTVLRFIGPDGQEAITNAVAYVGVDLDVEGFLYLGAESELDPVHEDPQTISGVFQIKQFGKIPNLKATEFLRIAYLKKG